ncbi:hypothetical protein AAFF_G00285400 [Aldrovandia affinis]|uniref:Uncharacterized protein n=1 Tax=Aldrovandia affinis TaxID=143900 RepID=A0AAD7X223_9TELE|nr:hypothetical protein AAFF_G00285400 [Aldrovandia affinis]
MPGDAERRGCGIQVGETTSKAALAEAALPLKAEGASAACQLSLGEDMAGSEAGHRRRGAGSYPSLCGPAAHFQRALGSPRARLQKDWGGQGRGENCGQGGPV